MSIGVLVKRKGRYKPAKRTARGELAAIDPLESVRVCDGSKAILMPCREFEYIVNVKDSWERTAVVPAMRDDDNIIDADPQR